MLISFNWLKSLVPLAVSPDEFALRMMMAGFNHESTTAVGDDVCVDLEITSNRPDCLGHIGLAREAAVLFDTPLKLPAAAPKAGGGKVADFASVRVDCPKLCPRFAARVIRGVKIGPSPAWVMKRLTTIGQPSINNVVDITNYVLMENGQPLHAYDLAKLRGRQIIVREARKGEKFPAINHKTYDLEPGMCVIADAEQPVGLGGVMGGLDSEVSSTTKDLLIEAADFDPLCIRNTARKLALRSDSSYRFERGVDPEGIDWASRRCCELILETCGGELADGVIDVGAKPQPRKPIVLRLSQLKRIIGIDIPVSDVLRILASLGLESGEYETVLERISEVTVITDSGELNVTPEEAERLMREQEERFAATVKLMENAKTEALDEIRRQHDVLSAILAPSAMKDRGLTFTPPSWRRDLDREIDLIEEVARIYGYDKIPEDVSVPMAPSARTDEDRVLAKLRHVLTACGFDEALTISLVDDALSSSFSPWSDAAPLALQMPILERADKLRRSLVPSLLKARRENEAVGNATIELFETAKVYLPRSGQLPEEVLMLGLTSGRDFFDMKGTLEAIVGELNPTAKLAVRPTANPLFTAGRGCDLLLNNEVVGILGEVAGPSRKKLDLRGPATVAEIKLAPLVKAAVLVPRYAPLPAYPAIDRDINLVVDEAVRWSDVDATIRSCGGELLARYELKGDPFRDEKKLGPGKKSLLVALVLQSRERTLTGTEADDVRTRIVEACAKNHGATLRA